MLVTYRLVRRACEHGRSLPWPVNRLQTSSILLCISLQPSLAPFSHRKLLSGRHTSAAAVHVHHMRATLLPPALPPASISAPPSSLASVYVQSFEIPAASTPAGARPRGRTLASPEFCLRGRWAALWVSFDLAMPLPCLVSFESVRNCVNGVLSKKK